MKFYIVDAFTDRLFGGNPAGVVILSDGQDFPNEELMLKTAAELRYSETAFIRSLSETEFSIRYFTPTAEVELCGHATIASFCALMDAKLVKSNKSYINITKAGKLNINVLENSIFMDMAKPEVIEKIADDVKIDELYTVMGLSRMGQGEILSGEKQGMILQPEIVSTGLADIMLPVRNENELNLIKPDFKNLSVLSERYKVTGVHAFTVNSGDGRVHCRNFAPLYGIDEEAATGTSNGALTFYLYKNGLLQQDEDNLFIQGEAMKRPSKIMSHLSMSNGNVKIQVGGTAKILASGEIRI